MNTDKRKSRIYPGPGICMFNFDKKIYMNQLLLKKSPQQTQL